MTKGFETSNPTGNLRGESLARLGRYVASGCGFTAAALGLIGLAGRASGTRVLASVSPAAQGARLVTAIEFLVSGAALACLASGGSRPGAWRHAARGLATAVAVLAFWQFLNALLGWHSTAAWQLLLAHTLRGAAQAAPLGAHAFLPTPTIGFVLFAAAVGFATTSSRVLLAQSLALVLAMFGLFDIDRYVLGGMLPDTGLALRVGAGQLALGAGMLCARCDGGFMAMVPGDSDGGKLLRWMLVPSLLLPMLVSWAYLQGELVRLYDGGTRLAAIDATNAVAFTILVLVTAGLLHRGDSNRRSMLRTIREQRDRLAGIIDTEPECVKVVDARGNLLEMNPAGLAMLEVDSLDEARMRVLTDYIPGEHRAAFMEFHRGVIAGRSQRLEFEITGRKGTRRWVETYAAPLRDANNAVYALLGITRDISAQKRIEKSQSEARLFRDLLDYASDLMYIADVSTQTILDCNAALPARLGFAREEVIGSRIDLLTGEEVTVAQWAARMDALKAARHLIMTKEYRCRDGTPVPVEINTRYVELDSRPILFSVIRDVSERRRAEAALQEGQRLLQAASRKVIDAQENERRRLARELHDTVGQELTALALNLTLIRAAIPAGALAKVEGRLRDSQDLVEETSVRVRKVMGELRPPGLDELGLLAALREHAARVASRTGLTVKVQGTEPQPRLPPEVTIALFRIAQEALNNTVKHARASALSIELTEEGERITLGIADNGWGFDPGARAGAGRCGMGMTTMRERAEAIGATLTVDAMPGSGTCISLELPRGRVSAVDIEPAPASDSLST